MDFLLNDFVAFQRSENPNSYNEFYLKTKEYFSLLDKICADKIQKFDDNYITIARNAIDNIGIEELSLGIFNTLKEFQNDSFENVFGNKKTIDSVKKICNSLLHYFPSVQKNPYPVPSAIIFSGEPGTGKTMVARAMVNYLSNHAKLFKKNFTARFIDQTIKDRYYGESEKILKEAFEAVKNHNGIGILVVDEADTIFPPINYSNGILETSLMGLLLNELDGIKRSQRNNFTSVFITNRPYNGIMDALHSRAKEFVFEKYQDNIGYKMQIENYLLGLGFASSERFDLNEISNTCLDFSLSGRDVKNILDTLFYEKSVVGLKNLFQKRNFSEIKFETIKEFSKIENKDFIEGIKSFYIEKEKLKNNELSEKIRSISEAIICQEMGKDLALEKLNYKNEK
jgi:SpoVK/Ycf46/Vps4 family AAA+-type ATPase